MSTDDLIEPELRGPTPRTIRSRFGERFGRWMLVLFGLIAPAVATSFGVDLQRDWDALRDHGKETVGRVVQLSPRDHGKNGHGPRAAYSYDVDGTTHSFWDDVTDEQYARLRIDTPTNIRYLPEKPEAGAVSERVAAQTWSSGALMCWIISGIAAACLLPIWFYLERSRRAMKSLARDGVAIRATALEYLEHLKSEHVEYWRTRYTYVVDGATYSAERKLQTKIVQKLQAQPQTTVLYDPLDPNRSELYATVASKYHVES